MKTFILALIFLFLFIIIRHFLVFREHLSCLSTTDLVTQQKNIADISNSTQQLNTFLDLVSQAEKNAEQNANSFMKNVQQNIAVLHELCPKKCPHMYASDSLSTQKSKCSNACCTFEKNLLGNACQYPFNKPSDGDGEKEAEKHATTQIASPAAKAAGLLGVTWTDKDRSTI